MRRHGRRGGARIEDDGQGVGSKRFERVASCGPERCAPERKRMGACHFGPFAYDLTKHPRGLRRKAFRFNREKDPRRLSAKLAGTVAEEEGFEPSNGF